MKFKFNAQKTAVAHQRVIWYAWHPVLTEEGVVVWLENVFKSLNARGSSYYRLI